MAPTQATLLPINDDLIPYVQTISESFGEAGLRITVDDRAESLNKKIRDAQLGNVPLIITIGNKEKEAQAILDEGLKDMPIRYEIYGSERVFDPDFIAERMRALVDEYRADKEST